MIVAAGSWVSAIAGEPLRAVAALIGVVVVTAGVGVAFGRLNRRARSLRHQVLAITLAALAIGAASAAALGWLMVLDPAELGTVMAVLGIAVVPAAVLNLLASAPLGRDVTALAAAVERIEHGDRTVQRAVDRRDELGDVSVALDALTRRLDELEREQARLEAERTMLLSSVSHDLRTPLTALRAAVEALADGLVPDPPRYYAAMARDVDALTALVEDLFVLVRLDEGRDVMPASSVDLAEVADEAIEALTPTAVARDVKLLLDPVADGPVAGAPVTGNAPALGRVIRNLLDNAIRHAPAGSTVTVTVDRPGRRVRVIDEGSGFPEAFADHAFERFTKADASRSRATGGAGLGLAIARRIVDAHGGRIWIEPAAGGHVAFELPVSRGRR